MSVSAEVLFLDPTAYHDEKPHTQVVGIRLPDGTEAHVFDGNRLLRAEAVGRRLILHLGVERAEVEPLDAPRHGIEVLPEDIGESLHLYGTVVAIERTTPSRNPAGQLRHRFWLDVGLGVVEVDAVVRRDRAPAQPGDTVHVWGGRLDVRRVSPAS
ncbi:MAG TPA: hypothetical protein VIN09_10125 [Chloroflexota bacterium]